MAPTFDLPPLDVRRVGEVAARLHVSRMTVRRLIASGRLPALRYSPRGVYLVPAAAVDELLERSRVQAVGTWR